MNRLITLFYERKRKSFYLHLQKGGTEGKTGSPGGNLQAGINKNKEKERKKKKIKPCNLSSTRNHNEVLAKQAYKNRVEKVMSRARRGFAILEKSVYSKSA